HEEEETRDPRRIGFPLEPMERAGEARRSHGVLHDAIESAAMHRPELTRDTWLRAVGGWWSEPAVQPIEVERGADPRDTRDHVTPPERQVKPLAEMGLHFSCRGTWCSRTGSRAAARDNARRHERRT